MTTKVLNRNALRSKKAIKQAFVTLLQENEVSKVKVKDILILADVSRSTFYAHYRDIYDVLEEIENESIEVIRTFLQTHPGQVLIDNFLPFIEKIFSEIMDNEEFFKMLFLSSNASSFLGKLQKVFIEYMMEDKVMLNKLRNEEQARLFFSFISIGTANLLQEWFANEHSITFDELAILLNECIITGISAIKK